jgi:transcriptional regulator with XRE-family HTH domain
MARAIIASTGLEFGEARKRLGISLAAVAAELGCSPADLERYERDPRQLDVRFLTDWGKALANAVKQGGSNAKHTAFWLQ